MTKERLAGCVIRILLKPNPGHHAKTRQWNASDQPNGLIYGNEAQKLVLKTLIALNCRYAVGLVRVEPSTKGTVVGR